ncbi:MAG: rod shape-determining protein RodA [Holosporales bacterium]|jgi:rod shape determining protein RodA|nr:rod shape-determining protein RodA [Holosporales bacterium]
MIVLFIQILALVLLYSMSSGHFSPWCFRHVCRIGIGIMAMFIVVLVKPDFWKRYAYWLYLSCLSMLIAVSIIGKISMGAQRWLDLYFFNFQPSELMRIILIIVLAKYFSFFSMKNTQRTSSLIVPILLTVIPMSFVLLQPDLGTAVILFLVGASTFFVCGVQIWKFVVVMLSGIATAPILWNFLHEYQKNRILMFLSPEIDPNGAGYHIIQSKIALGSGGFWGKGLMNGTQCQLDFLPEKQTDFMFAALGEELGFMGCLFLISLYFILLTYNLCVFLRERSKFNQVLVFGLNAMLFFYIFINIAMVCGLLPVVGIPLPFFSYGGSALSVLMSCQGLIFSIDIEQKNTRHSLW